MKCQGMNQETIESELSKWENEEFIAMMTDELGEYVNKLDKILYERYKKIITKISSEQPHRREGMMKRLIGKGLMDNDMNYIGASNAVKFDKYERISNAGCRNGTILVNPNSAKQFYAAYIDFSNGFTEGIRELDYTQPLNQLENLSSLEVLYWYYINKKPYQEFLKTSMLHETVHRWTYNTNMFDDSIDIFINEGCVELEARKIAEENDIEYAHCFRVDEVNLVNYLEQYNRNSLTGMMLICDPNMYGMQMLYWELLERVKGINLKDAKALAMGELYQRMNRLCPWQSGGMEVNYREAFKNIKPDISCKIIEMIEESIDCRKAPMRLRNEENER